MVGLNRMVLADDCKEVGFLFGKEWGDFGLAVFWQVVWPNLRTLTFGDNFNQSLERVSHAGLKLLSLLSFGFWKLWRASSDCQIVIHVA